MNTVILLDFTWKDDSFWSLHVCWAFKRKHTHDKVESQVLEDQGGASVFEANEVWIFLESLPDLMACEGQTWGGKERA